LTTVQFKYRLGLFLLMIEARKVLIGGIIAGILAALWSVIFTFFHILSDPLKEWLNLGDYEPARIDFYAFTGLVAGLLTTFAFLWLMDKYGDVRPNMKLGIPIIFIVIGLIMAYNIGDIAQRLLSWVGQSDYYYPAITLSFAFFVPPLIYAFDNGMKRK